LTAAADSSGDSKRFLDPTLRRAVPPTGLTAGARHLPFFIIRRRANFDKKNPNGVLFSCAKSDEEFAATLIGPAVSIFLKFFIQISGLSSLPRDPTASSRGARMNSLSHRTTGRSSRVRPRQGSQQLAGC
jgi:hypothetical protein